MPRTIRVARVATGRMCRAPSTRRVGRATRVRRGSGTLLFLPRARRPGQGSWLYIVGASERSEGGRCDACFSDGEH